MKPHQPLVRSLGLFLALVAFVFPGSRGALAATLSPEHTTYVAGETIRFAFAAGPGNARDWVGLYPEGVTPGPTPSTRWYYVNNTQTPGAGLTEGTLTFEGGVGAAGTWTAFFLLNDGYDILAQTNFTVVEEGIPSVRTDKRQYQPGEDISVTFTNGLGNPKDWLGLYPAGAVPGAGVTSLRYLYADGTQGGSVGVANGTVTFAGGLGTAGSYVVHFLANDGYDILASEPFTVAEPTGSRPRILSVRPADGTTNVSPKVQYAVALKNGTATVVPESITLKVDDAAVTPVVSQAADVVTVGYTNTVLFPSLSGHSYTLTYRDTASTTETFTNVIGVQVGGYVNVVLPAPLHFEDFDATAEDALPVGWAQKSYTEVTTTDFDLANLDSASYARWTVIAASRLEGPMVGYSNPAEPTTDYQRVLSVNPLVVRDGQVYDRPLAQGRFVFATSGYRYGRSQVEYLYSPDFDVSGSTNIHLSFHSLWEQNQDAIAAVEYSINQGQTWLPVAYFLDGPDIYYTTNETSGVVSVDAVTTLTTPASDIPTYLDDDGIDQGGTYGAFIGAAVTEALAPFIQARKDDDPVESKRIELFRLPLADRQATVRLRFAQAGSDSWYFGLDDVGLYAMPGAVVTPPTLTLSRSGDQMTLQWPADAAGFALESTGALGAGGWTPVAGVTGTSHTVTASGAAQFYRLRR